LQFELRNIKGLPALRGGFFVLALGWKCKTPCPFSFWMVEGQKESGRSDTDGAWKNIDLSCKVIRDAAGWNFNRGRNAV
jgi:hypothetical protein